MNHPVGTFVAIGVTYLVAESIAAVTLVIAAFYAIGIIMVILTVIWVIFNPIPTLRGWILFLSGGTTLLLLPPLFVYAVPLRGHTHLASSQIGAGGDVLLLLSALWLVVDAGLTVALYGLCRDLDFSEQQVPSVLCLAVVSAAILLFLFTRVEDDSSASAGCSTRHASFDRRLDDVPMQIEDEDGFRLHSYWTDSRIVVSLPGVSRQANKLAGKGYIFKLKDSEGFAGRFKGDRWISGDNSRTYTFLGGPQQGKLTILPPQHETDWCLNLVVSRHGRVRYRARQGVHIKQAE